MDALHKANPMISYQDILLQYAAWSRMISEDRLHFPYFRKGVKTRSTIDINDGDSHRRLLQTVKQHTTPIRQFFLIKDQMGS